jgi:hypothetical protein
MTSFLQRDDLPTFDSALPSCIYSSNFATFSIALLFKSTLCHKQMVSELKIILFLKQKYILSTYRCTFGH